MKRSTLTVLAAAIGLAFGTVASAHGQMSKTEYHNAKEGIEANYKTAKTACGTASGNANDICEAKAKGAEKIALAELEASYKPSREARHDVEVAKADAAYAVAKEECDDKSGNAKDVCVKEAKAAHTTAKADAKVHLKTADAHSAAAVKTNRAQADASTEIASVKKSAAAGKRDAQYSVAKEKCDALSGDPKEACMTEAKAQYGKL